MFLTCEFCRPDDAGTIRRDRTRNDRTGRRIDFGRAERRTAAGGRRFAFGQNTDKLELPGSPLVKTFSGGPFGQSRYLRLQHDMTTVRARTQEMRETRRFTEAFASAELNPFRHVRKPGLTRHQRSIARGSTRI